MLPTLHLVASATRFVVSLHALAIAVGVAAGALLVARRAPAAASGLATAALVAVAALVGAHGLFRALHGGARGGWSGGRAPLGGVGGGGAPAGVGGGGTPAPPPR